MVEQTAIVEEPEVVETTETEVIEKTEVVEIPNSASNSSSEEPVQIQHPKWSRFEFKSLK